MKVFFAVYSRSLKAVFEYRGDFFVYFLLNLFTPLVSLAVWLTVQQVNSDLPYNRTELIWYFVLAGLIGNLTVAWHSRYLNEEINSGDFSKYLLKPLPLLRNVLGDNLAEKTPKLPIVLIAFLLLVYLTNISISVSTWEIFQMFILVIPAIILSIIINVQIQTIIGLLTFWVHDITFAGNYIGLISDFFSGSVVPIVFLPGLLFHSATILPFRYIISFPIEIIMGKLSNQALLQGFIIEIFWCFGLYFFYQYILFKGIKSYQSYGV